eukprot:CAMPEP_0181244882 /NCGR_PEP_ID=MMETSP1096-20121128/43112_1 /TAXON_ID=156174 ORGANISM="Chrysochromulina ericina, Strain CCMP281" /NCGR_SAMPLE_ID=MMETSP1096 /ASSEMBLY_ACC=CAM_ASM_000453 /LENGTH=138 /DNA_ID=CAMNT_0023341491 /DNA_START=290 /DNA_END=706 /DNA_ORIENTATION=-
MWGKGSPIRTPQPEAEHESRNRSGDATFCQGRLGNLGSCLDGSLKDIATLGLGLACCSPGRGGGGGGGAAAAEAGFRMAQLLLERLDARLLNAELGAKRVCPRPDVRFLAHFNVHEEASKLDRHSERRGQAEAAIARS